MRGATGGGWRVIRQISTMTDTISVMVKSTADLDERVQMQLLDGFAETRWR